MHNSFYHPNSDIDLEGGVFERPLPQKSGLQCNTAVPQMLDFFILLKSANELPRRKRRGIIP
jgi:hypothetical protein